MRTPVAGGDGLVLEGGDALLVLVLALLAVTLAIRPVLVVLGGEFWRGMTSLALKTN